MKKLFSALLTICVAINMLAICPVTAFAASDTLTVKANSVEVSPGDEATITISITNNPGFTYLRLSIDYDSSALTLKSAKNNNILGNGTTSQTTDKKPYILSWGGAANTSVTGDVATVTFTVSDKASAGTYSVDLAVEECSNEEYEDVPFAVASKGSVKVNAKEVSTTTKATTTTTKATTTTTKATTTTTKATTTTTKATTTTTKATTTTTKATTTTTKATTTTTKPAEDKIVSVKQAEVKINAGVAPKLPDTVEATYESGKTSNVAVKWNNIEKAQYAAAGTFNVEGTVTGFSGKAVCKVTVGSAVVVKYDAVSATVAAGYLPEIQDTVKAYYSDGSEKYIKVEWSVLGRENFMTPGTKVEIKGVALDASAVVVPNFNDAVVPTAIVEVTDPVIVSANKVTASTEAGTEPKLPATVSVTYSNDTTGTASVVWDAVDAAKYANAGSFTVSGKIAGTNAGAVCEVTVKAKSTTTGTTTTTKPETTTTTGSTTTTTDSTTTTTNATIATTEASTTVTTTTDSTTTSTDSTTTTTNATIATTEASTTATTTTTTVDTTTDAAATSSTVVNTTTTTTKSDTATEDETIENVKTGENNHAMVWIFFASSVLAMCCVVIKRKYYNSECK